MPVVRPEGTGQADRGWVNYAAGWMQSDTFAWRKQICLLFTYLLVACFLGPSSGYLSELAACCDKRLYEWGSM